MTILNKDKLKKFRETLYNKKVAMLLRQGGKGLNPLKRYKKDEKGLHLVYVQKIIQFFLDQVEKAGPLLPEQYFSALFSLFQVMSRGAETISFDCGFSVSLEDIQDADNKTTIDLLTTNIIITYFNTLKTHQGGLDTALLSPDLKLLISKSNAGRDYKELVGNTLAGLTQSLEEDKPWREYLEDLNDADLICWLTGSRLPSMEKETMARIIGKSRQEIQGYSDLFTKILNTRGQLTAKEGNKKIFLKSMEKLNTATLSTLDKTDNYLRSAHRLMGIFDLSYPVVMGKADTILRQNLVRLFLGAEPGKTEPTDGLKDLGIALARYRLNMLFNYPDITLYCRSFKADEAYAPIYYDLFRLLYKDVVEKLTLMDTTAVPIRLGMIRQHLREIIRAVNRLHLERFKLKDGKQALKNSYVALIHKVDYTQVTAVIETCDQVSQATQDVTMEIMASIRTALIEASFSALTTYAQTTPAADRASLGIKKRLNAFAIHYKPQREFYQIFFHTYMGSAARPMSPHLADFINTNKMFATALLMVFSDEATMKDLISAKQIAHAAALLDRIRKKK